MPSAIRLLILAFSLWAIAPARAHAQEGATTAAPLRVLFVGNSLTYANNLPRLLRAVAASQPGGPTIETATYAIPGAELDELWDAGHAATALREGQWDVVVLQERGGLFSCIASATRDPECRRSESAHRRFTELATEREAKVLLLQTWPPARGNDLGDASRLRRRAERLTDIYDEAARRWSRGGGDVEVVPAAAALYRYASGKASEDVLVDGIHPSVQSSLVMAAQLYRALTGRDAQPADLLIDFPLLPANAMVLAETPIEAQPQIAGDGSKVLLKGEALAAVYAAAAE